jgi:hypothetical protein
VRRACSRNSAWIERPSAAPARRDSTARAAARARVGEQRQARELGSRVGHHAGQQRQVALAQRLDRLAVEQVGVVLELDDQPALDLEGVQREVELRDLQAHVQAGQLERRQAELGLGEVEVVEEHLEQRVAPQLPLGLERVDEALEGHVLVREGVEHDAPNARQQLAEGRVARQVAAQHEVVHEEADQPLDLAAPAGRDGRAHDEVLLAGVPREQHGEGREHGLEARHALALAEPGEPVAQPGVDRQPHEGAAMAGRRGPRPVARQLERGHAGELLLPPGQVGLVTLPTQRLPLPPGVVGVLHRQRRQRRGLARHVGAVERGQLAEEDEHRPAVRDDVVQDRVEHVVLVPQAEQP